MEYTAAYALPLGSPPPAFQDLPGVDGKPYSLADFAGKPLVVAWWCNHCPYVRAWEERTVALARESMARGVAWVAINANDATQYPTDDMPHMIERAREKSYPFPYLLDASQDVARAYGATVTPHFQVFDKAGKLAYQGRLDDNKDNASAVKRHFLKEAIEAVIVARPPPTRETPTLGCSVKWRA